MRLNRFLILIFAVFIQIGYLYHEAVAEDLLNHLTITHGIWADTDLPDLPGKVVSGNLDFEDSYYVGLTYARTLVDGFSIPIPYTDIRFKGWDLELEGSLLRHYNFQTHWEAAAALVLRTRRFIPLSFLGWTVAGGWGFSYAFDEPALEKGPDGTPGEDAVQFQNHLVLEVDFFYPGFDRVHLITRIHHRSGMYGVISPQETGSNFLAAGIRLDF
jgi:hypothetical protein